MEEGIQRNGLKIHPRETLNCNLPHLYYAVQMGVRGPGEETLIRVYKPTCAKYRFISGFCIVYRRVLNP